MSNYIVGHIRTWTPMIVGAALTWLSDRLGIVDLVALGPDLTAALTSLLSALYYGLVRLLAERWPWVGMFLGINKAPEYAS